MTAPSRHRRYAVVVTYAATAIFAVAIDQFTDQSGGALFLATLLIAFASAFCFFVGQFTRSGNWKWLYVSWLFGAILVLLGFIIFSTRGTDAPKTGEVIFTYAMLIIAPPASFALPLIPSSTIGHEFFDVIFRSILAWAFCMIAGTIQWLMVRALVLHIRNSRS
ncbi:hypothetical protein QTI33_33930 [Variovorax sp. J22P271]|uniref:hypothetical protein n=1 Tax=Variovorax davisae TaxID=3053515 RepID=UPI002578E519|nr:hypothetical protein [Variovorax sp. J22P271]MDM0037172.1 hypothetical protein [Variovorax sp. J22P271]